MYYTLIMKLIGVEWDEDKNEKNKRIITARAADKTERRSYNGYYHIDGKGWSKAT